MVAVVVNAAVVNCVVVSVVVSVDVSMVLVASVVLPDVQARRPSSRCAREVSVVVDVSDGDTVEVPLVQRSVGERRVVPTVIVVDAL